MVQLLEEMCIRDSGGGGESCGRRTAECGSEEHEE